MADVTSQENALPEHVPVLYDEVLDWLDPHAGGSYIDATVGLGGHASGILERSAPDGRLLALDADPMALEVARENLAPYGERVTFVHGHHRNLVGIAEAQGFMDADGILLDLGVSSMQLDRPERGFSFQEAGPLDMRMDPHARLTADEIVNQWPTDDIANVIYEYGEERYSRRVARAIVEARPIQDTAELARVVSRAVRSSGGIHPATRTFQGLRIAVNAELESLEKVLPQTLDVLAPGGVLAVIAFHSLEDRIVKQFIVRESKDCICPPRLPICACDHVAQVERLTRRPIRPSEREIAANPRSRSARLRVARRLPSETEERD